MKTRRRPAARRSRRAPDPGRGGHVAELLAEVERHPEAGPVLTGGDPDADWVRAYSSGEEGVGGSVATPDQDVVDEIGRALGVEYGDEEELQGGDEITDRDRHRWELDPASKDDFDEE